MSARPPLGELKVGQKVVVRRSLNDMRGRKAGDRYIPAVVTKAARVWVEIGKPGAPEWSVYRWRMRRDTQAEDSLFSGSNASFATLEQHAWDETQTWALGVLRDNKIDILPGSPWRGREMELAGMISKGVSGG